MEHDNAQGEAATTFVRHLDEQYRRLHTRSCALIEIIPAEQLYRQPRTSAFPVDSCGEHLLRSAAAVEQTFGGITANLWDDPFEWTLPEALPAPSHVAAYLKEVEATRQRGFARLTTDASLRKEIMLPSGEMQTLCALLLETLARAAHHQGRAFASFRHFCDQRLPEV